jgi:hypothetical protein
MTNNVWVPTLTLQIPGTAAEMVAVQDHASNRDLDTWAAAAKQLVDKHHGVSLAELTLSASARPTLDGSPHGIYFLWLDKRLIYVGSNTSRMFHERLAAHLGANAHGWFNSCVRVLARAEYKGDTFAAVEDLVAHGRVAFWSVGHLQTAAQKRVVRQVENRLRRLLTPLNAPRGGVRVDDTDDMDARRETSEANLEVGQEVAAEVESDLDNLAFEDKSLAAGEVLFVKCGATWPGTNADQAVKVRSVLGDWKIAHNRAAGVGTVAGVSAGRIVAAWTVRGFRILANGRVRFQPGQEVADLESLGLLIRGGELGWTVKYAAAA